MALTKMQTLILWALLAKPGATAPQKDFKPTVKKADRDALKAQGLVAERKQGRGLWLEVTERGWAWASDHLDAELPTGSTAGAEILRGWLSRIKLFLDAKGFALADLLAPVAPSAALPERIRAAYLDCTGGALNQRLFLAKLRKKLPQVDRVALDDALRALHGHDGVQLSGTDNPRELSQADRAASLDYKGEAMFVIWITR
jgi:hypothetical protein